MTKKQKLALKALRQRIQEKYGKDMVTIHDVVTTAKQEMRYNVLRLGAIFELRKEDFYRFLDNGFTPPYFENAFRRYFNIKRENRDD